MRVSLLALLMLLPTLLLAHEGGSSVGNGGDAVQCTPRAGSPFNGEYALDYLLTYGSGDGDLAPVSSWENSSARILALLKEKAPALADSFADFVSEVRNTQDFTRKRLWEPAPFGLVELRDQKIVNQVPVNCQQGGAVRVVQAVIRQGAEFTGRPAGTLVYRFVPSVLDALEQQAPLQLSFLMVHEWLWDVSDNVDRNRRLNRFLHSRALETLSPAQVKTQLQGLGLSVFPRPNLVPHGSQSKLCLSFEDAPTFTAEDIAFADATQSNGWIQLRFQQDGGYVVWEMELQREGKSYAYTLTVAVSDPSLPNGYFQAKGKNFRFTREDLHAGGLLTGTLDTDVKILDGEKKIHVQIDFTATIPH